MKQLINKNMDEIPKQRGVVIYIDGIELKDYPLAAWNINAKPIIIPKADKEEDMPKESNQ